MALDRKDLELLAKPFPVEAHKFLNDLIYLHEEPVCERLDEVDPSWAWEIVSVSTRPNAGEGGKDVGTVTVHGRLTIKGVSRDGVGMATIQRTNLIEETRWDDTQKKKVKTGNQYTNEANEAEKSASTDALKRATRMFGIGRYLLTMGKGIITDDKKLATWLKQHYPDLGEGKS